MDAPALVAALTARGATLATAESLTGGRLAAAVTSVPGASRVYVGGAVTYATALKESLLGVPEDLVWEHGVVSAECARSMASGVRGLTGATYAAATTGVAGPDSQEGKPVGTVYVAVAGPSGVVDVRLDLAGDREEVQRAVVDHALALVGDVLQREEPGLG